MVNEVAGPVTRSLSVLAEWTNACNLRCPMCVIGNPGMRETGHMSLELWCSILDSCLREGHYVDWVHVLGEPLLWRHFDKGMALWRESGLLARGHISTNGHLLSDERIDCIAANPPAFVRICVDTLRDDVYLRLRGDGDHAKVIANAHRFLRRARRVDCQIQLMRSALNPEESPQGFFKEFGYRKNLTVFVTDCHNVGGDARLSIVPPHARDPRSCAKLNYEHCPITWDGRIGLCCVDCALRNQLGVMREGSIAAVYLGERAESVRAAVRRGDYARAPACASCPMDHLGYRSGAFRAREFSISFRSKRGVRRLAAHIRDFIRCRFSRNKAGGPPGS